VVPSVPSQISIPSEQQWQAGRSTPRSPHLTSLSSPSDTMSAPRTSQVLNLRFAPDGDIVHQHSRPTLFTNGATSEFARSTLDDILGINNGKICWGYKGLLKDAQNLRLDGSVLSADIPVQAEGGVIVRNRETIDLSEHIYYDAPTNALAQYEMPTVLKEDMDAAEKRNGVLNKKLAEQRALAKKAEDEAIEQTKKTAAVAKKAAEAETNAKALETAAENADALAKNANASQKQAEEALRAALEAVTKYKAVADSYQSVAEQLQKNFDTEKAQRDAEANRYAAETAMRFNAAEEETKRFKAMAEDLEKRYLDVHLQLTVAAGVFAIPIA